MTLEKLLQEASDPLNSLDHLGILLREFARQPPAPVEVEEVAREIAQQFASRKASYMREGVIALELPWILSILRKHLGKPPASGEAKSAIMNDPNDGHCSGLNHPWNPSCEVWGCVVIHPSPPKAAEPPSPNLNRAQICEWTRGWFDTHHPATIHDFDLASLLLDFAQFFQPKAAPSDNKFLELIASYLQEPACYPYPLSARAGSAYELIRIKLKERAAPSAGKEPK